ncbi:iron dicitrate transport regulator FecR [Pseudoduganella sp. CY13W]|uniref:Iron dicitrate transport regulator FecR n=2 Tax=Duganella qianjiadongensis TaxID=2692176 RepID=A0ABW9VQB8_9BURK|nr:FecR family protein [Duganella qianjiadongensis]MYM41772.1 iron dicitrate transport regulator FecR [Duganella qianjiadongensis]
MLGLLLAGASAAWAAQVAGTIVQLSGPLLAKKADGTARILSLRSEVEGGDTLMTEKNTYAMVKFIDNSEITLKPNTTFKVEKFSYEADKPDGDSASFNLVKGGLRSVTGLLGKRNKEKFSMKTPSATIGIRGTTFTADWIAPDAEALAAYNMASTAALDQFAAPVKPLQLAQAANMPNAPNAPGLQPGLYVQVIDGMINLSNRGGSQNFSAGQFGYTATFTHPPVVVPANPALQFNPPPSFNSSQNSPGSSTATPAKPKDVDCIVR